MSYPQQTYSTIQQLLTYINSYVVTNGQEEITAIEVNNVVNALANFIVKYTLNSPFVQISNTTNAVTLAAPMTVFTTAPASIQWNPNVQNEYYVVNATGFAIAVGAGQSYVDAYGTVQNTFPLRQTIHIAQMVNGSWIQVNNLTGSGGGGGLPPQTGHVGQTLFTNGSSASWGDSHLTLSAADFQSDGVTYLNPIINVSNKVSIFWSDLPNFLYQSNGDWQYVAGGFKILNPAFNANTNPNIHVELFFKGISAE